MKVVDRTALILDIFAQHAKSKEGQAQVELAQWQVTQSGMAQPFGETQPCLATQPAEHMHVRERTPFTREQRSSLRSRRGEREGGRRREVEQGV